MSDFHNLQEENRRLTAEVERLKAILAAALPVVDGNIPTDDPIWLNICEALGRDPEQRVEP